MKNIAKGLLLFLISTLVHAHTVTDDVGQQVVLKHPAQRIISLAPDLTELLFAAGAGDRIVGVMQGSDYPAAAKKIPRVANYQSVNIEAILALRADLIVVWTQGNLAEKLKRLGIPIYRSQQEKLTDIPATLKRLGYLAGTEKIANRAAEDFLQRYTQLQKTYANKKPLTVFYQVWMQPLITVSKSSWINEVISLCGGRNIFADLKGAAPAVNLEAVITANPDVIIGTDTPRDWQKIWRTWKQLNAVLNNHIYSVNPDWVERAGPRILDGVASICRDLALARGEGSG